jgi:hypothetical protein
MGILNKMSVVFYPDIFSGKILEKILKAKDTWPVTVGLAKLSGKVFTPHAKTSLTNSVYILNENGNIEIDGEKYVYQQGSVFLTEFPVQNFPKNTIVFHQDFYLPTAYLNITERFAYANMIYNKLDFIRKKAEWKQCIQKLQNLPLTIMGKGCYGNVYKGEIDGYKFAVKIAKLKPEALKQELFSCNCTSWNEVYILKNIFRKILEKNICPNLPLHANLAQ